jgi:hypothetical protein
LQVALAYPGRALSTAFLAYFFGGLISGVLTFGTAWIAHSLLGVGRLASPAPMFIVLPFVSVPLWYGCMYAEIRGWCVSDNSD